MGGAVFSFPGRDYVLVGLMLFLPLWDRGWRLPKPLLHRRYILITLGLLATAATLLAWRPSFQAYAATTLLMAALPEEWFFRVYFMPLLGEGLRANVIASVLFSLMHGLTRGWAVALAVFLPSLFYGWLYQRTRDLSLLVLVHTLSNLVFAMFLSDLMATGMPILR